MNKVSLQDIAKQEFLSSQYLSYKIKEVFGHSFNEYLNQIRVEESTKLLLDTDKSIGEIAEDVGFSHVRYYNKHFKIHYKSTPVQYRKRHKVSEKQLEKMKKIEYLDIKEAIPYLQNYLLDYERFNYDNKITKLDIDLNTDSIGEFNKPKVLDLGDISLLLEEENRRVLKEIQSEIAFKYGLINNLFSDNMDIYKGKNKRFINWTRVENIIEFIIDQKLFPVISTRGIERYIIDDFINYFSRNFENVESWLDYDLSNEAVVFPNIELHHNYDRLDIASYIIYNYTNKDKRLVLSMMDEIDKETTLDNETFFGGKGMFTVNYLNKPSFYAYKFLSLLGDEIIYNEEGYIITRSEKGYQILLYNPARVLDDHIFGESSQTGLKEKRMSLNLFNMERDFQITKYDLNKSFGSVYDKWLFLGSPDRLSEEQWTLLDNYVHPNISFYFGEKSSVFNLLVNIKPSGCILYTLNYGQNT